MIFGFGQKKYERHAAHTAYDLYCSAVAVARDPDLYNKCRIPDTIDGRFDALVLHISMLLHRLEGCADRVKAAMVGQALFDTLFKDMDQSLREKGVGDMGVPRHMKRMLEGFNGRHTAYRVMFSRLDSKDATAADLADLLARNIHPGKDGEQPQGTPDTTRLADYVVQMTVFLRVQPDVFFLNPGYQWTGLYKAEKVA